MLIKSLQFPCYQGIYRRDRIEQDCVLRHAVLKITVIQRLLMLRAESGGLPRALAGAKFEQKPDWSLF